jgi:hypothetical protein
MALCIYYTLRCPEVPYVRVRNKLTVGSAEAQKRTYACCNARLTPGACTSLNIPPPP